MKKFITILSILSLLVLGACSKDEVKEEKPKEDPTKVAQENIKEVIQLNLDASESENLEKYKDTLTKELTEGEEFDGNVKRLFDDFDLDYELMSIEELVVDGEEGFATVKHSVKATKSKEGLKFTDSVLTTIYSFVKVEGKWKISSSDVYEIVPLAEYQEESPTEETIENEE